MWKDRLQGITNRGFLFLLPGLALTPYIMESGLLTEGTCVNLQGRLDYSHWVLEEAETQEGAVWVAKGKAWEPTSVPPQVVIAASQIQWTADVTKCLMTAKERSDKKILKVMKKKQVGSPSRMGPTWSWNWCVGGD